MDLGGPSSWWREERGGGAVRDEARTQREEGTREKMGKKELQKQKVKLLGVQGDDNWSMSQCFGGSREV